MAVRATDVPCDQPRSGLMLDLESDNIGETEQLPLRPERTRSISTWCMTSVKVMLLEHAHEGDTSCPASMSLSLEACKTYRVSKTAAAC